YYETRKLPSPGAFKFSGSNPEYGALITYYLKTAPASADARVTIQITDAEGAVVREIAGPDRQGFNRIAWDLRYPLTFEPGSQDEGWFGPPKGTLVLPGSYRVRLTARGRDLTETLQVLIDQRSRTTPEALKARFQASQTLAELVKSFTSGALAYEALEKRLTSLKDALKGRVGVPAETTAHIEAVAKELVTLKEKFRAGFNGPKFQYLDLAGQLQASTSAPTDAQLAAIEHLKTQLRDSLAG